MAGLRLAEIQRSANLNFNFKGESLARAVSCAAQ